MERKRIEKLVTLLLIGILIPVSLFPFRINADTISNSNVNINYHLVDVSEISAGRYMQTYDVDFIFDKSYLGWISSRMVGTYVIDNTVPSQTSQYTVTKAIYVNGSIATTSFTIVTENTMNGGALQSLSQSIQNSNVTPLADLSTLDDILNILTDINNNIEIDILDELQNIVSNTSLANTYLDTISKMRQFNIPIESYGFISYSLQNYSQYLYYFNDLYSFQFPVYRINTGITLFRIWSSANIQYDLIFIDNFNTWSQGSFSQHYQLDGVTINSFKTSPISTNMNLIHVQFTANSNAYINFISNYTYNIDFVPIYFNVSSNKNISTDFAIRFGLRNELLDNIQTIANGTQQSQSASGSLDQTTSQFSDDANDLVTIEESFNNSMNQSLQSVNPTFNMGSSFLTSANWVSQQFNRIVNNTPFASLITFGLTLGLGLLIIGKVRK